jgi:hypothetical protein
MVHFISSGKECIVILDIDNDGDGSRGEYGKRGIDLNRNFPSNWLKADGRPGGTGDFPTSAPETHAI